MSKPLVDEAIKPCPKCGSDVITLTRFAHCKEGLGTCEACKFFAPMKAYSWKKITRLWNEIPRTRQ